MEWRQGKLWMAGEVVLLLSMAAAVQAVQAEPKPSAKKTTVLTLEGYPNSTCDTVTTPGLACGREWSLQQDAEGVLCFWLSKEEETLSTARSICQEYGGHLLSDSLINNRNKMVVGFVRGASPKIWYDSTERESSCGSFSYGTFSRIRHCYDSSRFVCVSDPVCASNRMGKRCQHECHCLSGQCHVQPCFKGCQHGWRGAHCCMKEAPADIAYYCVKTESRRYMMLRVDPKSIHYGVLEPVDSAGQKLEWCQEVTVARDRRDYSYTIVVPVLDGDRACAGHKTENNTYIWRLELHEMKGVQLPFDRSLVIACDFEHAETNSRDLQNSIQPGIPKAPTLSMGPQTEDVALELVDPATSQVIHEAEVGRTVMLRMRLSVSGSVTAQGVSPYNCEARSGDGSQVRQLTDSNGCSAMPTIMSSLRGLNGTVTSKTFPLFAFPGQKTLAIDCHFTFCFTKSQQPLCDNRCAVTRRSQRGKRAANKQGEAVTTQVRILPDPGTKRPDASRMMTPVTWFLAAILLVVSGVLVYTLYHYAGPKRAATVEQTSI